MLSTLRVSDLGFNCGAAADGSIRHMGAWQQASWSPHGLFVAVSSGDRLAAVDPRGNVRWSIARPGISDRLELHLGLTVGR